MSFCFHADQDTVSSHLLTQRGTAVQYTTEEGSHSATNMKKKPAGTTIRHCNHCINIR